MSDCQHGVQRHGGPALTQALDQFALASVTARALRFTICGKPFGSTGVMEFTPHKANNHIQRRIEFGYVG